MKILGISCYFHDSAACLVVNGNVVASEVESRFTGIKHDNNFPLYAIYFCLTSARIPASQLDGVVFYEKPVVKFTRIINQHLAYFPKSRNVFIDTIGSWLNTKLQIRKTIRKTLGYDGPIYFIDHHLSHAASAYYQSGYKKSVIVTFDGVGEWATTTVGLGEGKKIRIDKEIHFPHSLGLLYSTITAYLGFAVNDEEGKVMELAAMGSPKQFRYQFDTLVKLFSDGSYALNMDYFDFGWSDRMFGPKLVELFGYPARLFSGKLTTYHADIAAVLQEKLEDVVFYVLRIAHAQYKVPNLCLAGGVAYNSVMVSKIIKRTPFRSVSVPTSPGDSGGALGAALYLSHALAKK